MGWYRAGTVTVTNGSAAITGVGTNFVENANAGEAMLGPDGRVYEIAAIQSATQLTLANAYLGGGAAGQVYAILPTQSFARDLALGAAELLNSFAAVRDGIGEGLIADGTIAAPGLRFSADQDTGITRMAANQIGMIAAGVAKLIVTGGGATVVGDARVRDRIFLQRGSGGLDLPVVSYWDGSGGPLAGNKGDIVAFGNSGGDGLVFVNGAVERARIDTTGNLLVGVASGTSHIIQRDAANTGTPILCMAQAGGVIPAAAYAVDFNGVDAANPASAAFKLGRAATGRSLNASGTVNAAGADYAEYMTKSEGCGSIAKGDVCGVDRDGKLTRTWAEAISFVIKSTDPAYVGGDIWAADLPVQPEQDDGEVETSFAARLAAWEAALEAARKKVDRIAFAGQAPVNINGDADVGDYLIPVANGGGIAAIAVPAAEITFEQYRRRIGKVWAIRDGRPWVNIQHG